MLLIGIIFLIAGFVNLYQPALEWFIKFGNTLRGTKTEITQGTVLFYRFTGVIYVLLAIVFIIFGILELSGIESLNQLSLFRG